MEKDVVVTSMPLYEVKLYLGSVDSVHDDDNRISRLTWEKETLVASIGVFQEIYKGTTIPVVIRVIYPNRIGLVVNKKRNSSRTRL